MLVNSSRGSGDSVVKNPPVMQETGVRLLGQEDPLKKDMATHSSILTWRIPQTEELGELQSMGSQRFRHDGTQHSTMALGVACTLQLKHSQLDRSWNIHISNFQFDNKSNKKEGIIK